MGLIGMIFQPLLWKSLHPDVAGILPATAHTVVAGYHPLSRHDQRRAHNFAYDMCVDRIREKDCEGLDLSSLEIAYSGAEPIREATLNRFTKRFAPYGIRREAFYPCYGLAESTLIVTGGKKLSPLRIRQVPSCQRVANPQFTNDERCPEN